MSSVAIKDTPAATNGRERYHDLDAFRAWAVLLGVVLHAAWLMLSFQANTPIVDVDHSPVASWIFWYIHLFRMQAFFLVAGFFGNMVYQKRGLRGFAKHRFMRIGVPLIAGTIILVPWCLYYYTWGGLISGATLSNLPFVELFQSDLRMVYSTTIPLWHLWFLWDLLLLYAATLLVKFIFDHWLDQQREWRAWMGTRFQSFMRSPGNITLLAVPSAILLLPMKYWIGVEGYPTWLIPDWYGFLSYWMFFGVGWLVYANRQLLAVFSVRWKYNLLVGTLLSFPIWGLQEYHVKSVVTPDYPVMLDRQIYDYSSIREKLLAADAAVSPDDVSDTERGTATSIREIWQRLSPQWKKVIEGQETLNVNQRAGFAKHLTAEVIMGETLNEVPTQFVGLEDGPIKNRKTLEQAFGSAVATELLYTPRVWALKIALSGMYGLAMWYLVFGFMGFFQQNLHHPSPAMRYVSDSSYWLYLLHLPITFWLAMYLAPIELGFFGKFAAYNILVVAILMPTYHYFVRSTWLGQLLNGRRYPYRPFFQSDLFRSNDQVKFEDSLSLGTAEVSDAAIPTDQPLSASENKDAHRVFDGPHRDPISKPQETTVREGLLKRTSFSDTPNDPDCGDVRDQIGVSDARGHDA